MRVSEEMEYIYPELADEFATVVMQVRAGHIERAEGFEDAGGARIGAPGCAAGAYGSVKRNEPKIMWACAVDGVPGATYQGARVR